MQRKIGTEVNIGKTVSPLDSISASSAIDRTASNYLNADEKLQKLENLPKQVHTMPTSQR